MTAFSVFSVCLFEKMLTKGFSLDPQSADKIRALSGKTIQLVLKGTGLVCQLIFEDACLRVAWQSDRPADLVITGTPLQLLRMQRGSATTDGVSVTGDMLLAREVLDLFAGWSPDWEEQLAKTTGDLPAVLAGRFYRQGRQTAKDLYQRLAQQLSEWLHEEIRIAPSSTEIQDFCADVDMFHMDLDRLAAQVAASGRPDTV